MIKQQRVRLILHREGLIEILAENQLHIASFNIAANRHPNIEAISQLMEKKNITIAGIQEVDVNTSRNNYDMVQSFIDQGYYSDSHFQKAMDFGGGQYGNAILSTYSLSNKGGGFLPWESGMEQRAYTRAEFEKDGKTVAAMDCLVPGIGEMLRSEKHKSINYLKRLKMIHVNTRLLPEISIQQNLIQNSIHF